jgi:hypothetical protein
MKDPSWYSALSRDGRDAVDQALHFLMGLGFSAVGTAAEWPWAEPTR